MAKKSKRQSKQAQRRAQREQGGDDEQASHEPAALRPGPGGDCRPTGPGRLRPADLKIDFVNKDGSTATQAGSHPFAVNVDIAVNTKEQTGTEVPDENARDVIIELPPGLLANPTATERCSEIQFTNPGKLEPECPDASAIGVSSSPTASEPRVSCASPSTT